MKPSEPSEPKLLEMPRQLVLNKSVGQFSAGTPVEFVKVSETEVYVATVRFKVNSKKNTDFDCHFDNLTELRPRSRVYG